MWELFKYIKWNGTTSLKSEEYYFSMLDDNGITFICLADETDGNSRRMAFSFLNDLQKTFFDSFTPNDIEAARAYDMDEF